MNNEIYTDCSLCGEKLMLHCEVWIHVDTGICKCATNNLGIQTDSAYTCEKCGENMRLTLSNGWVHKNSDKVECFVRTVYRNYIIGRDIDDKTMQFEQELEALQAKYDFYMDTESFDNK